MASPRPTGFDGQPYYTKENVTKTNRDKTSTSIKYLSVSAQHFYRAPSTNHARTYSFTESNQMTERICLLGDVSTSSNDALSGIVCRRYTKRDHIPGGTVMEARPMGEHSALDWFRAHGGTLIWYHIFVCISVRNHTMKCTILMPP